MSKIWRPTRIFAALLCAIGLGGCTVSTSFQGPGFESREGITLSGTTPVVVSITHATLVDDGARRETFWRLSGEVIDSLDEQPGLVGYSVRRELLGDEAWTMTVWSEDATRRDFIAGPTHRQAMADAYESLAEARFATVEVERSDIPLSWDRALELLDTHGRNLR